MLFPIWSHQMEAKRVVSRSARPTKSSATRSCGNSTINMARTRPFLVGGLVSPIPSECDIKIVYVLLMVVVP